MEHPLSDFKYCPKCGAGGFAINNSKSKRCPNCSFIYYFNPSAAVSCFVRGDDGGILVAVRRNDPAKGTLDLVGGFVDNDESAEEAVRREVREETGLELTDMKYIFSIPNTYRYSGFDVHPLDMFFECTAPNIEDAVASDDVLSLEIMKAEELNPADFGLESVSKAVSRYKKMKLSTPCDLL